MSKVSLAQRDSHEVTIRLKQADRSYRWFLARAKKLRDTSGDTGLVLVTHQDVHDKVLLERERDEQRQAAIAAARTEADQQLGVLLGQSVIGVLKLTCRGLSRKSIPHFVR